MDKTRQLPDVKNADILHSFACMRKHVQGIQPSASYTSLHVYISLEQQRVSSNNRKKMT